jgi:hypothetical protein
MGYGVHTSEAWIQHERTWVHKTIGTVLGFFKETFGKRVLPNTFPNVHGEGFEWLAMLITRFKQIWLTFMGITQRQSIQY